MVIGNFDQLMYRVEGLESGLLVNLKIWLTLVVQGKGRLLYFLPVSYRAEINLWLGPNVELLWQIS